MKRIISHNGTNVLVAIGLLIGLFVSIPIPAAEATNDVQASCVIGSSVSCPAQSPQEIYNLYGTTANGTYWLNVNGTATQTYLIMDRAYPNSGGWFLGMKGTKSGGSFWYSSAQWTDQTSTLNTSSLSNDVTTEAKFNAFNYLPVTQLTAVFRDRDSNAFNANGSGSWGTNSFAGHTWAETIASQTMFARFTANDNRLNATGILTSNYELYRESNSGSAKLVFPYMTGWYRYGFNNTLGKEYRWGIQFNNESGAADVGSSDVVSGIGLTANSAAANVTYSDNLTYGPNGSTGANNPGTSSVPSGFQIWGKMATPSMATPASLTKTTVGNGSVQLNIGAASGAAEYAVQYKLSTDTWANSTTVRLLNPNASPTATLTGLATGTYDFRVWTRGTNDSSNSSISLLSQTIDSTAPVISDTTYSTTAGGDSVYGKGDSFTVRMTFSEVVTVTGSPRIPIQGLSTKYFTYYTGSGTTVLDFNYVIAEGDLDADGVAILSNSLTLNGGTIKDLALNDAALSHSGLSATLFSAVDGVTPTASTVATSANGQSVIITLSETQSANALSGTPFAVTVGGVRDVVTSASQSGPRITLTLTFAIIVGDTVEITYTDPTTGNDTYALQDLAGNDVATFTLSVTNASTETSNTSITLALNPASTSAIYRVTNYIVATVNTSGRVDFKLQGKILAGCRNLSTSGSGPYTATCTWKPSLHNAVVVTASFRPTGAGFINSSAAPLNLFIAKRTNTR